MLAQSFSALLEYRTANQNKPPPLICAFLHPLNECSAIEYLADSWMAFPDRAAIGAEIDAISIRLMIQHPDARSCLMTAIIKCVFTFD